MTAVWIGAVPIRHPKPHVAQQQSIPLVRGWSSVQVRPAAPISSIFLDAVYSGLAGWSGRHALNVERRRFDSFARNQFRHVTLWVRRPVSHAGDSGFESPTWHQSDPGSSNGRTRVFEIRYRGSIPWPGTSQARVAEWKTRQVEGLVSLLVRVRISPRTPIMDGLPAGVRARVGSTMARPKGRGQVGAAAIRQSER